MEFAKILNGLMIQLLCIAYEIDGQFVDPPTAVSGCENADITITWKVQGLSEIDIISWKKGTTEIMSKTGSAAAVSTVNNVEHSTDASMIIKGATDAADAGAYTCDISYLITSSFTDSSSTVTVTVVDAPAGLAFIVTSKTYTCTSTSLGTPATELLIRVNDVLQTGSIYTSTSDSDKIDCCFSGTAATCTADATNPSCIVAKKSECYIGSLKCWEVYLIIGILIGCAGICTAISIGICYKFKLGMFEEEIPTGERALRGVVIVLLAMTIIGTAVLFILYKSQKLPFPIAAKNRDDGGTGRSGGTGGAVAMSSKDKVKLPPIKEKKTASVRPQPTVVREEDESERKKRRKKKRKQRTGDTGSAVSKTDIYPKLDGIPETNIVQHRSLPVPPSSSKTRGLSANFEEFPNMPSKKLAPIESEKIIEEEEDRKKKKKKKKSRKSDDDE